MVVFACHQDSQLVSPDSTIPDNPTIQERYISIGDIDTIEITLNSFFSLDSAELFSKLAIVDSLYAAQAISTPYDVYEVFDIPYSVYNKLLTIDPDDLMDDINNIIVNSSFESNYTNYIQIGNSIIFDPSLQLRWSWRDLFKDPCGFGATATLVAYSAARIIVGGASVAGSVLAVASVAADIYSYAQDCG